MPCYFLTRTAISCFECVTRGLSACAINYTLLLLLLRLAVNSRNCASGFKVRLSSSFAVAIVHGPSTRARRWLALTSLFAVCWSVTMRRPPPLITILSPFDQSPIRRLTGLPSIRQWLLHQLVGTPDQSLSVFSYRWHRVSAYTHMLSTYWLKIQCYAIIHVDKLWNEKVC